MAFYIRSRLGPDRVTVHERVRFELNETMNGKWNKQRGIHGCMKIELECDKNETPQTIVHSIEAV